MLINVSLSSSLFVNPFIGSWCLLSAFYRPQRSWGKVMFSQASVILSRRGVSTRHPPGADTPRHQTPPPPGPDTPLRHKHTPPGADNSQEQTPPLEQTPPWSRYPLGPDTPPGRPLLRAVRILLECILIVFNSGRCR